MFCQHDKSSIDQGYFAIELASTTPHVAHHAVSSVLNGEMIKIAPTLLKKMR
jgi:hypothetical protein